jgi:hypothetical protein
MVTCRISQYSNLSYSVQNPDLHRAQGGDGKGDGQNGNPCWFMLADDEGHGFAKKHNVDAYQEAMVRFWRKFLI